MFNLRPITALLTLALFSSTALPHGSEHHGAAAPETDGPSSTPPPASSVKVDPDVLKRVTQTQDWSKTKHLIGTVATRNAADLPERTPEDLSFVATHTYPKCEPPLKAPAEVLKKEYESPILQPSALLDYWDKNNPNRYFNALALSHDFREAPFPMIMCYLHKTDYYAHREQLQSELEKMIAGVAPDKQPKALDHYAWLLMYLGEFEKVLALFAPNGPHNAIAEESGSIIFALSQAYFRLGNYEAALPYGLRANAMIPDSILDTRWHVMLIELGLQGRNFLDTPGSDIYEKESIKPIFPNRDWESFPFEDVTQEMAISPWGGTGSVSFIDLDKDGWDELIWERKFFEPQIYKNEQGQKFTPISQEDLSSPSGSPIIFTAGDVDNDGLPDLFRHCCNYDGHGPTQLLKNEGNLKFKDVTSGSGLAYSRGSGMVVAWSDYDLDGYLDLVIADNWGPNRLYRNRGDGTFENTTAKAGLRTSATIGISFGDYNNDGWPDIWAQGWDTKWLYRNNKDGTFTDVTESAKLGAHLGQKGYMSFMFDHNNDGHLDLFAGQYVVSSDEKWGFGPICSCSNLLSDEGYSEREWSSATTIFENNGDGTFTNIAAKTQFVPLGMMGSNHGDWNNDGYEDLFFGAGGPYMQQAEPFLFYQNNGDGTYSNITPFEMLSLFGKGHGSAFTDFNHDGFLDLATNNGGAAPGDNWPSMLLKNKGNDNHWLQIKLNATQKDTNALSVGARVTVYAGDLMMTKEVQSGGQFGATNSLTLHYGLAKNTKVDKIVIRWPNKNRQTTVIKDIVADQSIAITQGEKGYATLWEKKIDGSPKVSMSK